MKTVSKAIAIQMKKKRDLEKQGDTGVYGKKLHANQSDVLKVQDVGKNQTFNMIVKGNKEADDSNQGRKHQIKMRKELLLAQKEKRKKQKNQEREQNNTEAVYNEILDEMGKNAFKGYSTSEDDDEQSGEDEKDKTNEIDVVLDNEGKPLKEEEIDEETKKQKILDAAIIKQPHIMSARSNTRFIWDVVIIVFAIVNGVTLPLEIAFKEEFSDYPWYQITDMITLMIFTFDLVVGFFTSYVNISSGDEIFGMRLIAMHYIFEGTFLVDIASTFPLDSIAIAFGADQTGATAQFLKIFGILKIQRLRRIAKIIGNMNQTQETKAFLKVAQMVFMLILYIHILACLLWVCFVQNMTWVPAVDFIYAKTALFEEELLKRYLSMCYHAIMVFGLNEVAPRAVIEILVVILMMIISAMMNAFIFGEMAVLVQEMDKKDIEFQESLDNANTAMHSLEIPDRIQDDIREYLMSVNEYKTQQNEMQEFMKSISPSLKKKVEKYIFFVAINQNALLLKILKNQDNIQYIDSLKYKKLHDQYLYIKIIKQKDLTQGSVNFFNYIVNKMQISFEEPEARIIKQNDNLDVNPFMFFIERGECIVQINDKDKMRNKSKKVRTLYPGDYFGEIAFLYRAKRSTSVTSTNYTTLGKINETEVTAMFETYPFFRDELVKRTIRYDDDLKIFLESALKTIEYLHGVPEETLNKIIFSMTFAKFDKGSKIFQVNETSHIMQIIQNGMVEIYTTMDNGVEFVIERLYRGSVINHRSFITEDNIDVNARCQMPVTLFYILWEKMLEIKEGCPILSKKIDQIEVMLINKDNPIALDYIISRDATVLRNNKKRTRKEQSYRDKLTVKLKNAVMFYIVKTRVLKRIPNFTEILNMAINKKKREMQAARRKQQEFDLDQLGPEDTYLTDEQFSLIKEQIEKIKLTLEDQETKIQSLKMKLLNLIKKNPQYQQF